MKSCRFCRARFKVQPFTPPQPKASTQGESGFGWLTGLWIATGAVVVGSIGFVFWEQHERSSHPSDASSERLADAPQFAPRIASDTPALPVPVAVNDSATPKMPAANWQMASPAAATPIAEAVRVPIQIVSDPKAEFKKAVVASQLRAMKAYPSLAVAGSHFNTAFVARYKQLSAQHDALLLVPDWPEQLAAECNARLPADFR